MDKKWPSLLLVILLLLTIVSTQSTGNIPFSGEHTQVVHQSSKSQPQEPLWSRSLGNPDPGICEEGYSLVECADNGFAIAGVNYTGANWDEDVLLIRTDSQGNLLWSNHYGIPDIFEVEVGLSLVECYDGGFAIAGILSNLTSDYMLLIRTNTDGALRWMKVFGNSTASDYGLSVVECGDHGFAVAGTTFNFGAENGDFWVVKTDIQGNLLWDTVIGGSEIEFGWAITECTSDSGFAITGHREQGGFYDVQLVRINSTGGHMWTRYYDNKNYDYSESIIECTNGDLAIVGYTCDVLYEAWFQPWLLRTDTTGQPLWNHSYPEAIGGLGTSVVEYSGGGFAITASTTGIGVNKNAWLIRTNDTGHQEQLQVYGFYDQAQAFSLTECSAGGLAFTGYINRTASMPGRDVWLVRLPDDVPPTWVDPPTDQVVGFGLPFSCQLTAQDPQGLDTWQIIESPLFSVDDSGVITNTQPLALGIHGVRVMVNDSYGNELVGIFNVIVTLTPMKLAIMLGIAGITLALLVVAVKVGIIRPERKRRLLCIVGVLLLIALCMIFFFLPA